ncbi:MG284/MPN403 family protein [Mycoplasma sp. 2261]
MLENKIKNLKSMSLQRKRAFIIDFCLNQKLKRIQNNMKDTKNVGLLDFFISSLSEDYKKIFINDFITVEGDSSWYLENWSKNAYYKKLNYLVDLFIDYVYCF